MSTHGALLLRIRSVRTNLSAASDAQVKGALRAVVHAAVVAFEPAAVADPRLPVDDYKFVVFVVDFLEIIRPVPQRQAVWMEQSKLQDRLAEEKAPRSAAHICDDSRVAMQVLVVRFVVRAKAQRREPPATLSTGKFHHDINEGLEGCGRASPWVAFYLARN